MNSRRHEKQRKPLSKNPKKEPRARVPENEAGSTEVCNSAAENDANHDRVAELTATHQRVTDLALLPRIEYDQVRKDEAKQLRVQLSTLDAEVEWRRREQNDRRFASASVLEDLMPWPEPVDGAFLLEQLSAVYRSHLALPELAPDAAALWILHTYTLDAADCSAFLTWLSPTPRCGKTTALRITAALAARAILASNITAPALFRFMERDTPTLILDEADTYVRENEQLRGVLNSGHTRDGAYVIRCDGSQFEPRRFCTWGAKSIALIGKLPPTLHDRSIVIQMRRKLAGEEITPLPSRLKEALETLRRMCLRWANDVLPELKLVRPASLPGLHDRAADNWKPLFAIAELAGGDWPNRARAAAAALSAVSHHGDGVREQLLSDIRDLFASRQTDRLQSQEIATALARMEGRPWPDWKAGKSISPIQIARLLAEFEIGPKPIRIGGRPTKGYELQQFEDAFARYLPAGAVTQLQHAESLASRLIDSGAAQMHATDQDIEIPVKNELRNRVTDQEGDGGPGVVEERF